MAAGWTAGVVLLTPLILLVGVAAVVSLAAVTVGRQIGSRVPARPRPASVRRSVVRLETATAQSSPGRVSSRAA